MATQPTQTSFPILGILGLIFITLKLTGYITWSWWWVLAPFWMPISIVLSIIALVYVIAFILASLGFGRK